MRRILLITLPFWVIAAFAASGEGRVSSDKTKLDLYGDPLPPGAIARMGTVQLRQAVGVGIGAWPLVFTPDGKTLLSASAGDRKLRFWDVTTGKQKAVRTLEPVAEHYWPGIEFSADGSTLAARVGFREVHVWKTSGDAPPHKIATDGKASVYALSLSHDGRLLVLGFNDSRVYLWDLAANTERPLTAVKFTRNLLFSPDSKRIALSDERPEIRILDVGTGKELRRLDARQSNTRASQMLAFSPDGEMLATWRDGQDAADESVSVWEVRTGKELRKLVGQGPPLAFAPNGKHFSTWDNKAIHVWDANTGKKVAALEGHVPYALAFSPDDETLAIRNHTALILWNFRTGKVLSKAEGHTSEVVQVAFSPNGKQLASLSRDKSIRLWESATGKPIKAFSGPEPTHPAASLAFTPDGTVVLCSSFVEPIRRWDVRSGKELESFPAAELRDWKRSRQLRRDVCVTADADMLVLFKHEEGVPPVLLKGWDVANGKELFQREEVQRFPELTARNGKGRVSTGLPLLPARGTDGETPAAIFSANGRKMAIAARIFPIRVPDLVNMQPAGLDVWETISGAKIWRLDISPSCRFTFSRCGRYLAAAGLDAIQVFDLATGKEALRFPAPERFRSFHGEDCCACCLSFAPDATRLATGLPDGTTLIWDLSEMATSRAKKLTAEELHCLWSDLGDTDAGKAYSALWSFVDDPKQALPYLEKCLRPVGPVDGPSVEALIKDLDSQRFTARDRANRELLALGERVEPLLEKALAAKGSDEFRRRAESILKAFRVAPRPEVLRRVRAIQALEQIGSPDAVRLLKRVASGDGHARETWEAQAALGRLRVR